MPDYVVDPDTQELTEPKFLDPKELADTIALVLEREPEVAKEKANNLKRKSHQRILHGKKGTNDSGNWWKKLPVTMISNEVDF